ncbi:MAG: N-acetylneuraminate synthase [Chloroflexi bacterium]|nr:N-acetylneuraminate synthase [Chloroflexota bacterium]
MKLNNIGKRPFNHNHPCFIIAEAGVNHNGSLARAKQLIDVAIAAGADAVKFQTFQTDKIISRYAPKAEYQQETTGKTESQRDMVRKLELSRADHDALAARCQGKIIFLSTPFDEDSADLLDDLGVPLFKIPSGEINNLPFLTYLAGKDKPLVMSTGMATLGEVETAVHTIQQSGNNNLVLLHCISNYPAAYEDVNLRAMQTMQTAFQLPVGFSDHTLGIEISLAAVALGACVLEKHFTLDKTLPGPDHRASLSPDELVALVRGIRAVEISLGHGRKEPAASEYNTASVARRSLVAAADIPAHVQITPEMIAIKRPGNGLPPTMKPYLIGRTTRVAIPADTLITWEVIL